MQPAVQGGGPSPPLNGHDGTISNQRMEEMSNMVDQNGGLYSFIGVDRLYSLMQYKDQSDMSAKQYHNLCLYRAGLVGTVIATHRDDCLKRLVQIGGLDLLKEWLIEAHKGRLLGEGENSSSKDLEKIVDDLLLIILKSLEKLPVNLQYLRVSNAGRAVKSLRSHKNPEVQKKANKLIDVWKKVVFSGR